MEIDPWTIRTQTLYPEIHARLERFLDACAEAAGHERVVEEYKAPPYAPPKNPEKRLNKIKEIRAKQKRMTDERNTRIVEALNDGRVTIRGVVRKYGLKDADSLKQSLAMTYLRKGYGDALSKYIIVRQMINEYMAEERKKARAEAAPKSFDGYTAIY